MGIGQLVSSFGQISFIAFVIVVAFLVFEVLQIKKQQAKKKKPTVPQFTPTPGSPPPIPSVPTPILENATAINQNKIASESSPPPIPGQHGLPRFVIFGIFIGVLVVAAGFAVFTFISATSTPDKAAVVVQEVKSSGIKVYNKSWQELKAKDYEKLQPGDTIIIGIATVPNTDIDMARIRVNENLWTQDHITKQLNPSFNVYYKEFRIPEGYLELQIDAQLHSVKQGWLSN